MIIFVSYHRHTFTHNSLNSWKLPVEVRAYSYDWLLAQTRIPKATYIFVDRERMDFWQLRVYGALFKHINQSGPGYKAINNPATMLNRRCLLQTLFRAGINQFNVYSATDKTMPTRYPVFIRHEYDHAKPLSNLIYDEKTLKETLVHLRKQGEIEDGLLIVEYCAEPVGDTLFRKLSSYRVGDQVFFYNTVHENNWLVKYGTLNVATDALYEDEQSMFLNNTYSEELKKAFDIAGIEYGRADFGLVDGKVQIYEINTNPDTRAPKKPHPNPIRTKTMSMAWKKYIQTLVDIDTTDKSAPFAEVFNHPSLYKHSLPGKVFNFFTDDKLKTEIRRH